MDRMNDFNILASQYKTELFENVIPFWLTHSQDRQYGGYFTCLDRQIGRASCRERVSHGV